MKKLTHIFLLCFLTSYFLSLASNLSAQSGWSEDRRLTFDYAYSADPRSACWGDTIHLVWWKNYLDSLSNYRDEVFYKRSTDAGATWGADVLLTPEDSISAVTPSIAVWGGNVHVAWKESYAYYYAICYRKSTDGGNTWGIIDTLHKTNMAGMRGNPRLCVYSDTVCLVTTRDDGNILFMKSTDNGVSWDSADVIGDGAAHPSFKMSKSISFYLMLSVAASEITEILFYKSTDAGETWSDSQVISENDGIGSQRPAMDTDDSSGIHITWYDYKYSPYPWTGDIFYRASSDSGNTWEEIDSLTVVHRATASDILAEGSNLHLVWMDDRNGFGNNFEIYYRMSTDLGQTWESEVRLTNASFHSRNPSLACDGDFLHLFWSDQRDSGNTGPWMLYYKRKTLVGINEEMIVKPYSVGIILNCSTILKGNSLIYYDLGTNDGGEIMILDIIGRVVETFPVHQVSGEFVFDFNKEVCDGIYFIMLRAGEEYTTKKVVVVK